ncbi:MAG: hypothetical protein JSS02_34745 [Planctomycetes bacterium]|nr:hypothetical protein [Planctomycetota bacterium]
MLFKSWKIAAWSGVLAVAGSASSAFGQCPPVNNCCPAPRVAACYRTVPVTEIRECRQTVQRPVVETKYIDQPVTEYKQVIETRTAEVPTCTYQNVTEMRTVQRDCGRWVTQTHQRPQMTACEYDNRPDMFGFLNRAGYTMRMAFTPQTWTERTYVPNVVTTQVPQTRQVAVRGTRTVNYQVAKVVPVTTTRRVAVNTVRMVCEEIVTKRPVTVFKTVPWGSNTAQANATPTPANTTTVAKQPADDLKPQAIMPKNAATTPITPAGEPTRISKKINETNLVEPDAGVNRPSPNTDNAAPKSDDAPKGNGSIRKSSGEAPADAVTPAGFDQEYAREQPVIGRWIARKRNSSQPIVGPIIPELAQTKPHAR